jgi:MFS family permease
MPYWARTFSTGYRDNTGQLNVTSSQSSAIVSILSAGTFFGALGAAPMGDILGRRWGLVASNAVFVLGVILQTIATDIPPFLAGRFFAGLGVGLISALGLFLSMRFPFFTYQGTDSYGIAQQSLSTSPRPHLNGSEASSSARTNLLSPSVSS